MMCYTSRNCKRIAAAWHTLTFAARGGCGRSGLLISSSLTSAHVCCRGTIQDLAAETGGLRKPTGAKPPAAALSGSVAFVLASATSQSGAISAAAPGKGLLRLCPCLDIFVL